MTSPAWRTAKITDNQVSDSKSQPSCVSKNGEFPVYCTDLETPDDRKCFPLPETKPHESLSKKESSEYEDAGFRYRPKPFCLQNPNRFQYNPEAASQAETSSIRMLPCRSASARPRLQSQHSSQGSITSSRTYLPNRSYEISYVPQTQPDKQVCLLSFSPLIVVPHGLWSQTPRKL